MKSAQDIIRLGTIFIIIGFGSLFIGYILSALQNVGNNNFGGLILIGPIPIAFGSSPEITSNMLWIGLIIMVVYLLFWRWHR
ncbi:MAG: DUF131 domain-containing protein [Methanosarcinaceae archaeon]|nr:DUF131 domain-containing protein [Methanosarcinaceae archaeon]